ncbi:MAG: SigB/SigF/SigG family RNA polymerase sigma factor [Ilumatobacter sp.]|nr:SigB/SigF/SigG family RNA polymerase sigma factor [Ilumatobacter sp.]
MSDDTTRTVGDDGADLEDLSLFREFAASRSRRLRNQLVERHMGLAAHIAKRYAKAGSDDDVRQVAMLGLVKSVDRFDPEFGASFGSFAGRTIEGEIKRFFRDKSWVVRVPRSAKELHLLVRRATDELSHQLGRAPTVDEIAEHLQIDRDDVAVGLAATAAYHPGSLDSSAADSDSDAIPGDRQHALADEERGYDDTIDQHLVDELLRRLPERERQIVELRFYEDKSQSEIAELVGMSQMHVSRLLRRSYEQMRSILAET